MTLEEFVENLTAVANNVGEYANISPADIRVVINHEDAGEDYDVVEVKFVDDFLIVVVDHV